MRRSTMVSAIPDLQTVLSIPGLDLGSDDEGGFVVTLFEDVHQGGGLFFGPNLLYAYPH
jgi:hypothetical protein